MHDQHLTPKLTAEIYSKPNCPYCVRAEQLLTRENIAYTKYDAVSTREHLIERVTKASGRAPQSVPQIFLGGQYIGGYTELAAYIGAAG